MTQRQIISSIANRLATVLLLLLISGCTSKPSALAESSIFTSDIDNFWVAFDKVNSTEDSLQQLQFLKELFIDKGTPGLAAMMEAKNYSAEEYQYVILHYPKFWNSIRQHTQQATDNRAALALGIEKLAQLYPDLAPANIYFTIGALRSNGTTLDSMVLIGSELAFANAETITEEFPDYLSHLRSYFNTVPGQHLVFLNIHEYVHTQQKTTIGYNLLAQTVIEGAAEFIAEKALNIASPNPQISFGRNNEERIREAFAPEMFSSNFNNWLWNSPDNEFGMRDLAYYVGYDICRHYYEAAADKSLAIRQMIELDYNKEEDLIQFVEQSGYFQQPILPYKASFEKSRPIVERVSPMVEGDQGIDLDVTEITIHFDQEMDDRYRGFDFGPLGEDNVVRITRILGFAEDRKSLRVEIEPLEPNKRYQVVFTSRFVNAAGIPLQPFLLDFKTGVQ